MSGASCKPGAQACSDCLMMMVCKRACGKMSSMHRTRAAPCSWAYGEPCISAAACTAQKYHAPTHPARDRCSHLEGLPRLLALLDVDGDDAPVLPGAGGLGGGGVVGGAQGGWGGVGGWPRQHHHVRPACLENLEQIIPAWRTTGSTWILTQRHVSVGKRRSFLL